ncbi:hypothetical protein [Leptospira levettii]|uniref:hypothetical protein n=1 Tax=Leptospira levettii TaxID=2023178 RepID=UPI00223DE114|nr:hypothetical protein [Leptospira levettii]MCW7474665.1 hypothetical protein [Leptospira levettii]
MIKFQSLNEKKIVLLLIVFSTFFSFLIGIFQIHKIHKKNLIELNSEIDPKTFYGFDFHFYGDAGFKWIQIQDLKSKNFKDITCSYPGKEFDPNFVQTKKTGVITIQNESCYYLFPYALSYIMYFPTIFWGQIGIMVFQHILVGFILYWMFQIGKILKLDFWKIILSLFLIRFGTSYGTSVFDLEEHILTGFLFLFAIYRLLLKPNKLQIWMSGFCIGLLFLFRPETCVNVLVYPLAIYNLSVDRIKNPMSQVKIAIFGIVSSILPILLLNQVLVHHPLGIKAFDPIHYVSFGERIVGLIRNLFYYSPFYFNPLLFQMPILVFALFQFRFHQYQKESSEIKFLYTFLWALPILILVSPTSATYYLGLRFAYFLYPIFVILTFHTVHLDTLNKKIGFGLFYGWSIVTLILSFNFSFLIYKGYDLNYTLLKQNKTEVVLVRDMGALMSLSDLYLSGKNILTFEEKSLIEMSQEIEKLNPDTEISIIQSRYSGAPIQLGQIAKAYSLKSKIENASISVYKYSSIKH